jgi:hypothetical protein
MAWTNIPNANLAIGAPIRSVDLLSLRDNVSAVPNGDTGAPRIKAEALNGGQSGAAPIYAARAWVNFNGTTSPGTIRGSGNVSSVTRPSTGRYRVNFSTAMPDANYTAVVGGSEVYADGAAQNNNEGYTKPTFMATTYVSITTNYHTQGPANRNYNAALVCVSIFR